MGYKIVALIAVFSFFTGIVQSQPNLPEKGEAFVDTLLPRVDIFIDPDTLEWIYENVESYQEFHADFIFDNGNILDTIEDVGFRLRGNTSRYSAKKSFKVSFNTFDPGRKWYGLEKLNLNGEHNDPTVARSKICWDILQTLQVPGSRANHVKLYINNNYHGLYINVEHIDEEFVLSRFGNNDGNLYKCLWPADLNYLGSNPEAYKVMQGDRRVYDLKTNTQEDDYSDLAHFIDVLNNTPDEDFLCEIEKIFNIYDYLKIIAFDVITANWDGYIYNKNNFYLYQNTATGKFEYINYDVDNTFGIDWFQIDWAAHDLYNWHQGDRPLYTRVMENQVLRDQYSNYIARMTADLVETQEFIDYIEEMKLRNASAVQTDPFYPLDYGFSYADYLNSFDEGLGMHVPYGIIPYLESRVENNYIQLEDYAIIPIIKYIRNNYPQDGEDFKVRATLDFIEESSEVKLVYSINQGSVEEMELFDDGEHADKEAGDGIYGGILPNFQKNSTISYQVLAMNPDQESSLMPCEPMMYELIESNNPPLKINEFMASNETTIADEFGEYDDWIEVFNAGNESIWLGDKYLTDNLGNSNKWLMPDFMLQPGAFVLFWADDDTEQGEFHTNFKLDADGEEIGIFDAENTGFFVIDTLSYEEQSTDVSKGRKPDGDVVWAYFTNCTPGYSNSLGAVPYNHGDNVHFRIYPNPATGSEVSFNQKYDFSLFTATGTLIRQQRNAESLNIEDLKPGLYFVVSDSGASVKLLIY